MSLGYYILIIQTKMERTLVDLIKGVGVEIGVWHGEGAKVILSNPLVKHVYLVDPYAKATEFEGCSLPPTGYKENKYKNAIENAVINTMEMSERAWFIFARSIEASKTITEPLDFVYIDANHNYEYVKEDLEAWYPKLKKGGILSGHDYPTESVRRAVDEFCEKNKLKLVSTTPDWYCYKP
jgi:hypothetical protein